jgi:hypothetical protein
MIAACRAPAKCFGMGCNCRQCVRFYRTLYNGAASGWRVFDVAGFFSTGCKSPFTGAGNPKKINRLNRCKKNIAYQKENI